MLGAIPSYYLRYYYAHDRVLEEQLHEPTRADEVQAVERELLALYADPSVDTKPEALERRGGAFYSEAAIELLAGLTRRHRRHPGGEPAQRWHPAVPSRRPRDRGSGAVHRRWRRRAAGRSAATTTSAVSISAVAGYERLALDAAVHGGRERVLRAMQAHPLVLQYDRAEKLTDLLLRHNAEFLPWPR